MAACGLDGMPPTATPSATPRPATPTPTPVLCDAGEALRQVDELLAGETFEAHYLTIQQRLTLSIWLVDPELDPAASGNDVAGNNERAFLRGASVAHRVAYEIPCVRELFEDINPMIVDREYNGWYIDIIPMRALPTVENPTDEELMAAIERTGMEYAHTRRIPVRRPPDAAVENACTWPEARGAIQEHFGPGRRNAAAYLIITDIVLVQAQWDVDTIEETDDEAVLEHITRLSEPLACLSPPVDKLEVFVVDQEGQLLVYGRATGAFIRQGDRDQVRIHHPSQDGHR